MNKVSNVGQWRTSFYSFIHPFARPPNDKGTEVPTFYKHYGARALFETQDKSQALKKGRDIGCIVGYKSLIISPNSQNTWVLVITPTLSFCERLKELRPTASFTFLTNILLDVGQWRTNVLSFIQLIVRPPKYEGTLFVSFYKKQLLIRALFEVQDKS